jgi:thiol:disulfide interchange protein DsbD
VTWTIEREAGVEWTATRLTARAVARIHDGWRLYSLTQPPGGPQATRIWLPREQAWTLAGPITGPEPVTGFDEVFRMDVETYVTGAGFQIPVKRDPRSPPGPVRVRVRYQMCNGELCLRPKTVGLELPVPEDASDPEG